MLKEKLQVMREEIIGEIYDIEREEEEATMRFNEKRKELNRKRAQKQKQAHELGIVIENISRKGK